MDSNNKISTNIWTDTIALKQWLFKTKFEDKSIKWYIPSLITKKVNNG